LRDVCPFFRILPCNPRIPWTHFPLDNFSRCASFLEIPDHQSKLETLLENQPFTAADIPVPAPILNIYRLMVNRSLE
jgi:hypothetical protein